MHVRERLHRLIDRLPETDLDRIERVLGDGQPDLGTTTLVEAPDDDEPPTPEDEAALGEAYADIAVGLRRLPRRGPTAAARRAVTKRIVWSERALKDADRLDARMRGRVVAAVERLAETGYGDVKRLRGRDGEFRLRVGDWRIPPAEERAPATLTVLRIRPWGHTDSGWTPVVGGRAQPPVGLRRFGAGSSAPRSPTPR